MANMNTCIPNPWMYCNYARENRFDDPCRNCKTKTNCVHKYSSDKPKEKEGHKND